MVERTRDLESLYTINPDGSHRKIQTADVKGRYQQRKKLVWALLIAVYLVMPWVEIGGSPAILIDIGKRHFYLFGATYNAQDFYLAFFLITGLGFSLFVISAMWGRIWCGYACPHTVFLEGVFRRLERWLEGNAKKRESLQQAGWGGKKIVLRLAKWGGNLFLASFLAHSFLSYFMPVNDVFSAIVSPPADHPTAFVFVLIFTLITYFNFTWFREQLCIVICPYGRLQSALYDRDTLNISYDEGRGEPRGKYTDTERGSCIECFRCVSVCPTGIDIRNGTQMECVGCANCIDACDEMMGKVGQEPGLIRYASQNALEGQGTQLIRPRVIIYAILLLIGAGVFLLAASNRTSYEATLHRTGAPYTIEDDVIQNTFGLDVINKFPERMTFKVTLLPHEGMDVILPMSRVEVDSLAKARLPVVVRINRCDYRDNMVLGLRIKAGDREHALEVNLLGVRK